MFIVTNRNITTGRGVKQLGPRLNELGPNELRIVEANKRGGKWRVDVLPDELTPELKQQIGVTKKGKVLATEYLYSKVLAQVNPSMFNPGSRARGKDLLLFVHGFNNDFEAVLERCHGLQRQYGVEVVAFTWPANGGGLKGATDYLDDKRDAQASVVAFHRVLSIGYEMISKARKGYLEDQLKVLRKEDLSGEELQHRITEEAEKHCPFRVTMLLHSMGNYLFERTLKSSALRGDLMMFDNVVMCAADVNNPDHKHWVERIQARNRLYITINEDDSALAASRLKGGDEQLARLGHYQYNLDASNAVYIDFTDEAHVGRSHAYFEGGPLKNKDVAKFFKLAFTGRRAESMLKFDPVQRLHRLK